MVSFPLALAPTYDDGQGIVPLIPGNPFGYQANRISEIVVDKCDANQVWVPDLGTVDARPVGIYANNILGLNMAIDGSVDFPVKITVGGQPVGNVIGPASSTQNAIATYTDASGKLIRNTNVVIDGDDGLYPTGTAIGSMLLGRTNNRFGPVYSTGLNMSAAGIVRPIIQSTDNQAQIQLISNDQASAKNWFLINIANELRIYDTANKFFFRPSGDFSAAGGIAATGGNLSISNGGTSSQFQLFGATDHAGNERWLDIRDESSRVKIRTNQNGIEAVRALEIGPVGQTNIFFSIGGVDRWLLNVAGHLRPNANDAVDIGAPTLRVANTYGVKADYSGDASLGGNVTVGGKIIVEGGTAAAPAISRIANENAGIFFSGNTIDFSAVGTHFFRLGYTSSRFASNATLGWSPAAPTASAEFLLARGGARQLNIGSTSGGQTVRILGSTDDVGTGTNWAGLELSHTGTAGQIATIKGGLGTDGPLILTPGSGTIQTAGNMDFFGTVAPHIRFNSSAQVIPTGTAYCYIGPTAAGALTLTSRSDGAPKPMYFRTGGGDTLVLSETQDVSIPNGGLAVGGDQITFSNLPTTDPAVDGRLWNDSGDVRISGGAQPLDLEDTDAGVYDLGTGTGVQPAVQLTGLTLTVPADAPSSDDLIVSIRVHVVNATTHTGAVEIGLGVNLAQPTTWIAHYIPGSFTGVINETFLANDFALTPGASLNVWARLTSGSHPQYNVSADGTTVTHTLIVQSN